MNDNTKRLPAWANALGVILFLTGIYGTMRVGINIVSFEKYPTIGVLPSLALFTQPILSVPFEEECQAIEPIISNTFDFFPPPTELPVAVPVEGKSPLPEGLGVAPKPAEYPKLSPTEQEIRIQQKLEAQIQQKKAVELCVGRIRETRDVQKVYDINQALFFVFLGLGLVIGRRISWFA